MKLSGKERKAKLCARQRAYYARSEKYRNRSKCLKLQKAYGITLEQYDSFSAAFDGVCHICENTCPSKRRLAVDHAHDDMKLIRGLLCINCNKGLGNFKDNVELLEKAIQCLRDAKETKEHVRAVNEIRV